MGEFRANVQTKEGLLVIDFTRIHTVKGDIYFVSVSGKPLVYYFQMERFDGHWKIASSPPAPGWLYEYEQELADCIRQNEDRN